MVAIVFVVWVFFLFFLRAALLLLGVILLLIVVFCCVFCCLFVLFLACAAFLQLTRFVVSVSRRAAPLAAASVGARHAHCQGECEANLC